jgi:hypothetical protein
VAACAGCTSPDLRISTSPDLHYNERGDYAGLEGTMKATRHGNTACYTLDVANDGSAPYALTFPAGWGAKKDLTLVDDSGRTVILPNYEAEVWVTPSDVGQPDYCPAGPARGVFHIEWLKYGD